MPLLPTHWVGTDVGIARDLNEDAFLWLGPADTEGRGWLWLVADGLGGAAAGDLAAALLVTTFEDAWAEALEEFRGFAPAVEAVVTAACRRIAGVEATFPGLRGMSAAVAIVAYVDGMVWSAHAGDCRVCRVRAGQLERLTTDHLTPGAAAELAGKRPAGLGEVQRLSRFVGAAGVRLDIRGPETVVDGDVLVITSDGVHGVLADTAITSIAAATARDTVDQLVAAAREGWSDDNLTAAVVRFGAALNSEELPPRTNVTTLPGPTAAIAPIPSPPASPNPLANVDATKTLSFSPDLLRQLTAAPPPQPSSPLAQQAATSTLLFSRADLAALEATSTRTGLLAGRIVEAARRAVEPQPASAPRSGNAPVVGVRAAVAGVGGDLGAARQRMEPYKPMPRVRRSDDTAPVSLELDDDEIRSFAPRSARVGILAGILAVVVVAVFLIARANTRNSAVTPSDGSAAADPRAIDAAAGSAAEGSAAPAEASGAIE